MVVGAHQQVVQGMPVLVKQLAQREVTELWLLTANAWCDVAEHYRHGAMIDTLGIDPSVPDL